MLLATDNVLALTSRDALFEVGDRVGCSIGIVDVANAASVVDRLASVVTDARLLMLGVVGWLERRSAVRASCVCGLNRGSVDAILLGLVVRDSVGLRVNSPEDSAASTVG